MRQLSQPVFLCLACFAVLVWALAAGLRPDAFYVGDQGVKLIATRNVLARPTAPFEIALPRIGTSPAPHVDPFFTVHDDHAHAVTSEIFPLLSAPMLKLFGLRGLYVWPALGFLGAIAACGVLSTRAEIGADPVTAMVLAGIGTPFLFYGLEFWEHTPAIALAAWGSVLLLPAATRAMSNVRGAATQTMSTVRGAATDMAEALERARAAAGGPRATAALCAGLLFGIAIALRAEAICFVAAVAASTVIWSRSGWRTAALCACGVAIALLPLEIYALRHFGGYLPVHVETNAGAMPSVLSAERWKMAAAWLGPGGERFIGKDFWTVAPAAVLALMSPFALARSSAVARLWFIALTTTLLVVLVAPNAGGGQWGVRYLLFSYVPLVVLAASVVGKIEHRTFRRVVIGAVILGSLLVQRSAFRELRGTKRTYGRMVDVIGTNQVRGTPLVTDVWWLDQLAAAPLAHEDVLFAGDPTVGRDIVRRLSELVVPSVTVVRSAEVSADLDSWSAETCYFEEGRVEVPIRQLVLVHLRHRCGYKP